MLIRTSVAERPHDDAVAEHRRRERRCAARALRAVHRDEVPRRRVRPQAELAQAGKETLTLRADPRDLAVVVLLVLERREARVERRRADRAARDEEAVDVIEHARRRRPRSRP